jgi:aminopeptidase N
VIRRNTGHWRAPGRTLVALGLAALVAASTLPASAAERNGSRPGSADPPDPYFPMLGNRGYDVGHYDLGIRYDPSSGVLHGDATITARATAPLPAFHLDFVGMHVRSVAVDEEASGFRRSDGELVVQPRTRIAARAAFTVRVRYSGTPRPSTIPGLAAPNGWIRSGDSALTLDEPDGARTWFPANDHPTDKASFTFRVTVPSALTAVANGALESRASHGTYTTWTWDQPAPMATYLTQIAIGHLEIEDALPSNGVTIRHAFAPTVRAEAAPAAAKTTDMMTFLSSWFGRFPFKTYGVLAPDSGLAGLAFEAQTFSLFAPDVFTNPRRASTVLAHEMAHQWFGDWVSPASWRETWLNEGFATYAEWLWSDKALGVPLARNVDAAYSVAVANPGSGAEDPGRDAMFSRAVYDRGALTLHALRLTVGDEAFVQILRTYLERFGGRTASTADFVAVASKVEGRSLRAFFASWLGPGAPPPLPTSKGPVSSTAPPPPPVI